MPEQAQYQDGRAGIKVPHIDESYAEICDVSRFFNQLRGLNKMVTVDDLSRSQELCLPGSGEKPLIIIRNFFDRTYDSDGNSVKSDTTLQQVCVSPQQPGALTRFLEYRSTRHKDSLRRGPDPYEFSETFMYMGQHFREPHLAPDRDQQCKKIVEGVQVALQETVRLLTT